LGAGERFSGNRAFLVNIKILLMSERRLDQKKPARSTKGGTVKGLPWECMSETLEGKNREGSSPKQRDRVFSSKMFKTTILGGRWGGLRFVEKGERSRG